LNHRGTESTEREKRNNRKYNVIFSSFSSLLCVLYASVAESVQT